MRKTGWTSGTRALGLAVVLVGCGSAYRETGAAAGRATPSGGDHRATLPAPPPGSMHAEGFGPTLREASLDAKRAVAEQLNARITSHLDARETEDSLRGGSRDVSQRIKTDSTFAHAELIEIRGDVKTDGGFVVQAFLDRDRAAEVYRQDIHAEQEKLQALLPVAEKAVVEGDAAHLLRVDASPGYALSRLADLRRILARIGGRDALSGTADDAAAEASERRISAARRAVVLRLRVEGEAPPTVRAAAVERIARLFAARGCTLTEADFTPVEPGRAAADVTLRLLTRDGRESGVEWRYLGLELEALDARSRQSFFRFVATPDLAKGGGRGWDQADRGLVKNLEEKLAERATPAFEALTCR